MNDSVCPSCKRGNMKNFYNVRSVPTNSCILLESRTQAIAYTRGDIELGFCSQCGFIANTAFAPALTEYSGRYEETQGFSNTFNKFHRELAQRLIDHYDLRGKDVLEIGCGKGEFISLLSDLGNNRGVGFDPGYREDRDPSGVAGNVEFIKDFYSEKYAHYQADFICCKMTLEHIQDPGDFLETVRRSVGDSEDTIVFFQIPEVVRILEDCAFEDVYYEHCSYFSAGSLARLFRSKGFDVIDVRKEYGDQYLTIEARPGSSSAIQPVLTEEEDLEFLKQSVASFPQRCAHKLDEWRFRLSDFEANGKKVVLWGSGSKGVSFLTTLNAGDMIEYVVDVNPYRQGYFMSGTGQAIVEPDFLKTYKPDVVIVMNPIYRDEIRRNLNEMQLSPELISV